ncbi:MAG: hypothetical protein ACOYZ7_13570 [Chloroflexota bacterium]
MGALSVLADISAVLVILEFMVLAALPLLVLFFVVRGMRWLNENLRLLLRQVQSQVEKARHAVGRFCQAVTGPFVSISVFGAQIQGFLSGVSKAWGRSSKSMGEVQ